MVSFSFVQRFTLKSNSRVILTVGNFIFELVKFYAHFCQALRNLQKIGQYIIFMNSAQQWRLPLAGRVFLAPEFVLFTFELTLSLTMNCKLFVSINLFKISFGFTAIYSSSCPQLFAMFRKLFNAIFPLVLLRLMLEL